MKLIIILGLFSLFNQPEVVEIEHDYMDDQIEISVSNFESEYDEYQEYIKKYTFKG